MIKHRVVHDKPINSVNLDGSDSDQNETTGKRVRCQQCNKNFRNTEILRYVLIILNYISNKYFCFTFHSGPENLKKFRPKKLVKSNKSISRKKSFDKIPFFAISKMAKNQFLN